MTDHMHMKPYKYLCKTEQHRGTFGAPNGIRMSTDIKLFCCSYLKLSSYVYTELHNVIHMYHYGWKVCMKKTGLYLL